MIVDTSAMVAILMREPERAMFSQAIEDAAACMISAGSYLELNMVILDRKGPPGAAIVDSALAGAGIKIVPFDEEQGRLAREAFLRFGKGRHRAALNFGDCMTYALAKLEDLPVLCKGNDFAATDLTIVGRP